MVAFAADKYTDYLMLHGLGVEMAEALAEMWHRRIRDDLVDVWRCLEISLAARVESSRGGPLSFPAER